MHTNAHECFSESTEYTEETEKLYLLQFEARSDELRDVAACIVRHIDVYDA